MCYFVVSKIDRPIIEKGIILIRKNVFDKLGSENFVKVLSSHDKMDMSKSYFYLMLNKARKMGLVKDNALSFKLVIPFDIKQKSLFNMDDGILYITDDKELIYINLNVNYFRCENCSVRDKCVFALKKIAKENDISISKENPREAWIDIIDILERNLIEKSSWLKAENNVSI
ncbi:MAG: hypothetical protein QXY60_06530 [Saccharolobus sp.]